MKKQLPEVLFKKLINPLMIEVVTFKTLRSIFKGKLNHNPNLPHRLKFNAILFITNGEDGIHHIDFQNYTYSKRSVLLIAKEQIHSYIDLPSQNEGYLLVFTEDLFLEVGASYPSLVNHLYNSQLYSPILNLEEEKFLDLKNLCLKIHEELNYKNSIRNEIAKSYLKILLLSLFQLREKENNFLEKSPQLDYFIRFQQLLRDHIVQEKKVQFYANQLNITSKKLNQVTKEIINISAKDFISSFVILEAKKYLKCSHLTSKEVAYELGFDEPTNFTKFFKKHTQMLPSEFSSSSH